MKKIMRPLYCADLYYIKMDIKIEESVIRGD
jgi:hypothetical protein